MTALAGRSAMCLALLALPGGLAGCADAQDGRIQVEAGIGGDLRGTIRESRRPDAGNDCGWLHVSGFGADGVPAHFMLWQVRLGPGPAGGADAFHLSFPIDQGPEGLRRVRVVRVLATAGGRAWEGSPGQDGYTAEVMPGPGRGFANSRFVLRGLRPADGGAGRIDLDGRWSCPARAPG